ncbi:response regulator transcription factor [Aquabacterium sp.]|uniref:response regulator transcription factor n=1 Tax=Aquabacterium sp. TaxID=1872578 RepID=UPI002BF928B0|nr:response regulator transcription factor [Aquabacterium sp.]HSW08816.1 response regulator transcription factor [Aquabacterium sp.]
MTRIFLVDDHALVRDGLRAMVENAGHEVVGEADNLTSALAGISAMAPQVLLLDLGLGERSGLELLVELRDRNLAVRTVIISMSRRPADVAAAMRLGAFGYVLKGSRSTILLTAIDAVAQGQRYLAPDEADLALLGLTGSPDGKPELTPRESQVLTLAARGRTSAAIGHALNLSPKTVDTYRNRAMQKLDLADMPSLVRWAIREGLIALDEE